MKLPYKNKEKFQKYQKEWREKNNCHIKLHRRLNSCPAINMVIN